MDDVKSDVEGVGWATLGRERLLRAASLDVEFVRAEGDRVYWEGPHGSLSALDLVGGFGATLLGHNHPDVVDVISRHLTERRPINVQGSRRGAADRLKQRLSQLLGRAFEASFEVMLLSTGTEAVEAALKHARLELRHRQDLLRERVQASLRRLRRGIDLGAFALDQAFYRESERILDVEPIVDLEALGAALMAKNEEALGHPGYVLAVEGAFHGKTMGALAATWNRDARLPFVPAESNVRFLRPGHRSLDELHERLAADLFYIDLEARRVCTRPFGLIAAILCEPIRGEGGVVDLEPQIVDDIKRFKSRHAEVPLIVDEIQTGLGRTGLFFESARAKLAPDYLTLGKSLGGGVAKISAVAIRAERYIAEYSLLHTSTFADDELSSAVAFRVLDVIEGDDLPARCAVIGSLLRGELDRLKQQWPEQIAEVRGQGLMLGVEFCDHGASPSQTIRALFEEDLLTTAVAGHLLHEHQIRIMPTVGRRAVLRLQPSAYLDRGVLPSIVSGFECVCRTLAAADAATLIRYSVEPAARGTGCRVAPREERRKVVQVVDDIRSRVAFVGHFIRHDDLRHWDPSLARLDEPKLQNLVTNLQGLIEPRVIARRVVRSTNGATTELSVIGIFMTSKQIEQDLRERQGRHVRAQVFAAYQRARALGCSLVGFGGYTSIATMNCTEFVEGRPAVTTGNALTVGMGYRATLRAAAEMGIRLSDARVAVCGATGNIGQVYARLIASDCASLSIIGRADSSRRLNAIASEIAVELAVLAGRGRTEGGRLFERFLNAYRLQDALRPDSPDLLRRIEAQLGEPLVGRYEDLRHLREADIVIGVSNSAGAVIRAEHLAGTRPVLVCDIALPSDVAPDVAVERPNVQTVMGGVVSLPCNADFELPGVRLLKGETFACTAETLALGLSGVGSDFSKGALTTDCVQEALRLADLHGFRLGSYKTERSY